jgi:thiol-disulfide isomerase/thioredoxin
MKRFHQLRRLAHALFLTLALMVLGNAGHTQINFNHGPWQEILAQAGRENKLVFLDCYASWCGPCKWMAANAFVDPAVSAFFNAHFVNAKIDMEEGEGPELSSQFGIEAYPTLIFVDASGKAVETAVGAKTAEALLELGKRMAPDQVDPVKVGRSTPITVDDNAAVLAQLKSRYAAGESNRHFLATYILALKAAGENYNDPLLRFKPGMAGAALLNVDNWNVFREVFVRTDSEQGRYFLSHISDFATAHGADVVTAKAVAMYSAPMTKAAAEGNVTAYQQARGNMLRSGIYRAPFHVLAIDMQVYQNRADWAKYAQTASDFVAQNPNIDPATLNNLAWGFYINISDLAQLKCAIKWANNACEDQPNYANLDTKAMLLKKLGRTREAITYAELAIEAALATGEDHSTTDAALAEMQWVSDETW